MYTPTVIRCGLSGSYRKDKQGLLDAYSELITCGCQVLSPHRLDFESDEALFVKDRGERNIPQGVIEDHHLLGIRQSQFVWLHASRGYIGLATAFEIGYAIAHNVPVFSRNEVVELLFQPFVTVVPSVYDAFKALEKSA